MFADNNDLYLGSKFSEWWKTKKKQRRVVVGALIGVTALVAGSQYLKYKGTKTAGDALAAKSGAVAPKTKGQSKTLWNRATAWFKKSGVAQGAAEAAVGEIVAGKRAMPMELQADLRQPASAGITPTTALVGGAAVVGAVMLAKD